MKSCSVNLKVDRGQWVSKSTTEGQESSFNVNDDSKKNVLCFDCGKLGHTIPNCNQPRNEDLICCYRALLQSKREKRGQGGGRRDGGWGQGGGRGGNRNGGKRNGDDTRTTPKNEKTPKELWQPPKANVEHEKVISSHGKCKWNGRTSRWEKIQTSGGGGGANGDSNQSSSSESYTANVAGINDTSSIAIMQGANFA